ncbi:hypothetical protein B0H11DRAFT_1304690 [Mycena galericulata]|nr:hypothetical protein B0H11DRAFT_1304690 [Mycena galericulata]
MYIIIFQALLGYPLGVLVFEPALRSQPVSNLARGLLDAARSARIMIVGADSAVSPEMMGSALTSSEEAGQLPPASPLHLEPIWVIISSTIPPHASDSPRPLDDFVFVTPAQPESSPLESTTLVIPEIHGATAPTPFNCNDSQHGVNSDAYLLLALTIVTGLCFHQALIKQLIKRLGGLIYHWLVLCFTTLGTLPTFSLRRHEEADPAVPARLPVADAEDVNPVVRPPTASPPRAATPLMPASSSCPEWPSRFPWDDSEDDLNVDDHFGLALKDVKAVEEDEEAEELSVELRLTTPPLTPISTVRPPMAQLTPPRPLPERSFPPTAHHAHPASMSDLSVSDLLTPGAPPPPEFPAIRFGPPRPPPPEILYVETLEEVRPMIQRLHYSDTRATPIVIWSPQKARIQRPVAHRMEDPPRWSLGMASAHSVPSTPMETAFEAVVGTAGHEVAGTASQQAASRQAAAMETSAELQVGEAQEGIAIAPVAPSAAPAITVDEAQPGLASEAQAGTAGAGMAISQAGTAQLGDHVRRFLENMLAEIGHPDRPVVELELGMDFVRARISLGRTVPYPVPNPAQRVVDAAETVGGSDGVTATIRPVSPAALEPLDLVQLSASAANAVQPRLPTSPPANRVGGREGRTPLGPSNGQAVGAETAEAERSPFRDRIQLGRTVPYPLPQPPSSWVDENGDPCSEKRWGKCRAV